ncbi:MAG TPA: hypothetical protein VK747_08655, partial [Blastocatellia bacterium]|nr:hypothetical protein [Blastocatellia bacterium]
MNDEKICHGEVDLDDAKGLFYVEAALDQSRCLDLILVTVRFGDLALEQGTDASSDGVSARHVEFAFKAPRLKESNDRGNRTAAVFFGHRLDRFLEEELSGGSK